MAGTVIVDTINSSVAGTPPVFQAGGTQIGTLCRAWVNFNGTGTVAIRASFNVSSITDNGTGDYQVNFTNAMPDANYSSVACVSTDSVTQTVVALQGNASAQTTSNVKFYVTSVAGAATDRALLNVAIFR
jgi:hypothetical protein